MAHRLALAFPFLGRAAEEKEERAAAAETMLASRIGMAQQQQQHDDSHPSYDASHSRKRSREEHEEEYFEEGDDDTGGDDAPIIQQEAVSPRPPKKKSHKKKPPLPKSEARQRLDAAILESESSKEHLEEAIKAAEDAKKAAEDAQKRADEAERNLQHLNETLIDELLETEESEKDWAAMYRKLQEYKTIHGDCLVTRFPGRAKKKTIDSAAFTLKLGMWVHRQRLHYKKPETDPTRLEGWKIVALNRLGFDWDPNRTSWMSHFQELAQFKKATGHFTIPKKNPTGSTSLFWWFHAQKKQFKLYKEGKVEGEVAKERMKMLDELGLTLYKEKKDKKGSKKDEPPEKDPWNERYEEMKQFVGTFHHYEVAEEDKKNVTLQQWTQEQRKEYRKKLEGKETLITEERVRLLEKIGFFQSLGARRWLVQLQKLRVYKKTYGNCSVPVKYRQNQKLADWVATQRQEYRKLQMGRQSSLTRMRLKMLRDAGMKFNAQKKQYTPATNLKAYPPPTEKKKKTSSAKRPSKKATTKPSAAATKKTSNTALPVPPTGGPAHMMVGGGPWRPAMYPMPPPPPPPPGGVPMFPYPHMGRPLPMPPGAFVHYSQSLNPYSEAQRHMKRRRIQPKPSSSSPAQAAATAGSRDDTAETAPNEVLLSNATPAATENDGLSRDDTDTNATKSKEGVSASSTTTPTDGGPQQEEDSTGQEK